jgi:hypothetical protein
MVDIHLSQWVSAMCVFELSEISKQESRLANLLERAVQTARNGHTISQADWKLTGADVGHQLYAVNETGRVAWGKAICLEVESHFDIDYEHLHPDEPVYLLTLVDLACSTAPDAATVDIKFIKAQLRHGLNGLSYVGMIEPAYYVNIAKGTYVPTKTLVSWHLHAVTWGKSKDEMKAFIARLNKMTDWYRPIAGNFDGADGRVIRKNELPETLAYILKSPTNSYRIANWYRVAKDGERVYGFKQNKGLLRPGERVTLFHLMKNMRLDELAMAGGEGARLLRRAKRRLVGADLPLRFSSTES